MTHVRVWAPAAQTVGVVLGSRVTPLAAEGNGYFSGFVEAAPGDRYAFHLDSQDRT